MLVTLFKNSVIHQQGCTTVTISADAQEDLH